MSKKKQKRTKPSDGLVYIKDVKEIKTVSEKEIEELAQIDHPLFSFKYLKDVSIDKCEDPTFFRNFLIRLQKLSELGWKEIRLSHRHGYGMEKIPVTQIIPQKQLPAFVTKEAGVDVFRSSGDNRVFVGLQRGRIFYIFFIEAKFGDICTH